TRFVCLLLSVLLTLLSDAEIHVFADGHHLPTKWTLKICHQSNPFYLLIQVFFGRPSLTNQFTESRHHIIKSQHLPDYRHKLE
ncbi:hypothetical protein, partial [uncultured Bacteroides sp.]|uniref:hypothetical protein n=1 Tax=uncultured Bacteroides sp. TaxID=162156 RepID=UPI0025B52590